MVSILVDPYAAPAKLRAQYFYSTTLCVSTVLLIFIDAGVISFEVKASWVDLLQLVLITVIGAYFGGRSLEKVKK